jgi:hypothetical protein
LDCYISIVNDLQVLRSISSQKNYGRLFTYYLIPADFIYLTHADSGAYKHKHISLFLSIFMFFSEKGTKDKHIDLDLWKLSTSGDVVSTERHWNCHILVTDLIYVVCYHFTCLSYKNQNDIRLENVRNLIAIQSIYIYTNETIVNMKVSGFCYVHANLAWVTLFSWNFIFRFFFKLTATI